jgi:acetyl esterase/lipase
MKEQYPYDPRLPKPILRFIDYKIPRFIIQPTRRLYAKTVASYNYPSDIKHSDIEIPVSKGTISALLVEPAGIPDNAPLIIYYHGGGFFFPLHMNHINNAIMWAEKIGVKVMMPNYRLAPEDPFPTPFDDCWQTYRYVLDNAEKLGINRQRIALYGDSAGGALAAAVAQMARDSNTQKPCLQMLIYPVTDHTMQGETIRKYPKAAWTSASNKEMWEWYLSTGDHGMIQYAAPLSAKDFGDLSPAYVEPHEIDCLCSEGIMYYDKLNEAGNDCELNVIKGSYHAADGWVDNEIIKELLSHRFDVMMKYLKA